MIKHCLEIQGVKFDLTTEELHDLYDELKAVVVEYMPIPMDEHGNCTCPQCTGVFGNISNMQGFGNN